MAERKSTVGWRYRFLLVYLVLLVASHGVRLLQSNEGELSPGQVRVELGERVGSELTERTVQVAYRDLNRGETEKPVLVIVHGSPMGSQAMNGIIEALGDRYRLIVPDLPGFGGSSLEVADYSGKAHAHYVLDLLDGLEIERAHFLGYSQGGAVILNVADLGAERVQSLTMLAAIGAQEVELLGDYTLNHGLYGMQWGVLWFLQEAVPHFGFMDSALLNVAFARNIWDTDQRPLRGIMQRYRKPMLIVHGKEDVMVPLVAAEEHARIVPHSELALLEGGHLIPFQTPDVVAERVRGFIDSVENGKALRRTDVSQAARDEAMRSMPLAERRATGWGSVFYMGMLVLGTQVTEDFTSIAGGLMASRGVIGYWQATFACFLGIFIGDILLYLAGFYLGRPALSRAPMKWFLKEREVKRVEHWYRRRGAAIILLARFVPGSRLPAYFTAGVAKVPLRKFIFFFALAAAIWTPILVGLAYTLGDQFVQFFESFEEHAALGLVALVLFFLAVNKVLVPMLTWKGRRMLLSTWRRWVRWEFWPMWLFYPPVFLYILYLGLKHRSMTLFTAVNPAMPESGFVEESKSAILSGLGDNGGAVGRWDLIKWALPLEKKVERLEQFLAENDLEYPVVLKPDIGQRGQGVAVIRSRDAAVDYLERCPEDVIAQAYLEGIEYGVFYYRYPGQRRGEILGITDKRLTSVTGDGQSDLERLILKDERAVCMAKFFLDKHADDLDRVPGSGEEYSLVELGTHCRGSIFVDGEALITEPLTDAIDAISQRYEGFYFGRYDLKVPSAEHLKRGEGIQVIELNGVTSEATYIYDPKHSVFFAWKTLFRQWRIAFEIAEHNRAEGAKVSGVAQLFGLFWQSRNKEVFEA